MLTAIKLTITFQSRQNSQEVDYYDFNGSSLTHYSLLEEKWSKTVYTPADYNYNTIRSGIMNYIDAMRLSVAGLTFYKGTELTLNSENYYTFSFSSGGVSTEYKIKIKDNLISELINDTAYSSGTKTHVEYSFYDFKTTTVNLPYIEEKPNIEVPDVRTAAERTAEELSKQNYSLIWTSYKDGELDSIQAYDISGNLYKSANTMNPTSENVEDNEMSYYYASVETHEDNVYRYQYILDKDNNVWVKTFYDVNTPFRRYEDINFLPDLLDDIVNLAVPPVADVNGEYSFNFNTQDSSFTLSDFSFKDGLIVGFNMSQDNGYSAKINIFDIGQTTVTIPDNWVMTDVGYALNKAISFFDIKENASNNCTITIERKSPDETTSGVVVYEINRYDIKCSTTLTNETREIKYFATADWSYVDGQFLVHRPLEGDSIIVDRYVYDSENSKWEKDSVKYENIIEFLILKNYNDIFTNLKDAAENSQVSYDSETGYYDIETDVDDDGNNDLVRIKADYGIAEEVVITYNSASPTEMDTVTISLINKTTVSLPIVQE